MRNYPSDLTDRQWQVIKNMLPDADRKRKHDLRTIWNGLMYLVKTGCQWRMLPKCFPGWHLVYYYYGRWRDMEIIEEVMHRLRELARSKKGKSPSPTAGIVDSQSVKGGLSAAMKGFDGNKKVNGRKRHIVTDTNGWLLAVLVHSANLHDSTMAMLLFRRLKESLNGILAIFADGGYRGKLAESAMQRFGYALNIVMRNDNGKKFKVVPKRWVVERSFAWMNAHRRLSKDYEFLCESSETMVQLSGIKILLNKI